MIRTIGIDTAAYSYNLKNRILQPEKEQQQRRTTTQVNLKQKPLQDQKITKQKKKKEIIIGDSMIKKIDGYLLSYFLS